MRSVCYDILLFTNKYINQRIPINTIQRLLREISKVEMSKLLGCGRATLYRWIKVYES